MRLEVRAPVGQAATQLPQDSQLESIHFSPKGAPITDWKPRSMVSMAPQPTSLWQVFTQRWHRMHSLGS